MIGKVKKEARCRTLDKCLGSLAEPIFSKIARGIVGAARYAPIPQLVGHVSMKRAQLGRGKFRDVYFRRLSEDVYSAGGRSAPKWND
jgi:hypothetical protein